MRRVTFGSYAAIPQNANQLLLAVNDRLTKMIDGEPKALHQGVHGALRHAASCVQQSFVDATEFLSRSLSMIIGRAKRDESAKLDLYLRNLRVVDRDRVGQELCLIMRLRL